MKQPTKIKNIYDNKMPFKLIKKPDGYILTDIHGHKYSKKPISKRMAIRQEKAVILSKLRRRWGGTRLNNGVINY